MKRIDTGDSDLLEYREPLGWGVLFTLPLFVVVFGFTSFLWSDLIRDMLRNANGWMLALGGVFVLIFVLKGLSLVNEWFVRIGVSVDRNLDTLTKQWGLFFPLPIGSYNLTEFTGYEIIRVTTRYRGSYSTNYHLYLTGPGVSVKVGRSDSSYDVESMAKEIMVFMSTTAVSR